MSCNVCTEFSPPGRKAELVATNPERWSDLYRCPSCGALWQVEATGWHAKELSLAEALEMFPDFQKGQ